MTIQLHLPDETVAALITRAQAQGRPADELAAEALSALFDDAPDALDREAPEDLDREAPDRLRRGFADLDAGRTLSLQDARRALDAAFQARFGGEFVVGGPGRGEP